MQTALVGGQAVAQRVVAVGHFGAARQPLGKGQRAVAQALFGHARIGGKNMAALLEQADEFG